MAPEIDTNRHKTSPRDETPFVSVVVPTRNRAHLLRSCLAHLLKQDYPPDRYDIIVVDDGSRDATRDVVEASRQPSDPELHYAWQRHLGPNAARNAGLRLAKGDPMCFVDDDVETPPGWLRALVRGAVGHPEAGCLGGPMHLRLDSVSPPMCSHEPLGESELDLGDLTFEVPYVWSGNMALCRHALDSVGLLQEHRLPGHDEVELIDRLHAAGIPVLYVGDAPVLHRRTADDLRLARLIRRRFRRGVAESVAYYRAGYAYPVDAQFANLREQVQHAANRSCTGGVVGAAHAAGRLCGLGALSLRDRIQGRAVSLTRPPG